MLSCPNFFGKPSSFAKDLWWGFTDYPAAGLASFPEKTSSCLWVLARSNYFSNQTVFARKWRWKCGFIWMVRISIQHLSRRFLIARTTRTSIVASMVSRVMYESLSWSLTCAILVPHILIFAERNLWCTQQYCYHLMVDVCCYCYLWINSNVTRSSSVAFERQTNKHPYRLWLRATWSKRTANSEFWI